MNAAPVSPLIERVLKAYGIDFTKVLPPQKGYRNQSFPVRRVDGRMVNVILYKNEPEILAKIKAANAVSSFLADKGLAVRHPVDPRILRMQSGKTTKYSALYNYLEGDTIPWEAYTQDHIKQLGKTMSDMHAALKDFTYDELPSVADEYLAINKRMKTYFGDAQVQRALSDKLAVRIEPEVFASFGHWLVGSMLLPGQQPLHMDFVRGNILFQGKPDIDAALKVSVSGILDFEKTAWGHPLYDIARTLAFLLVDCKYKASPKIEKYFLQSGYRKRGTAELADRYITMLEPCTNLFLMYDFYKFLRHNPYESLPENEHFVRTVALLQDRHLVVPTTAVVV